VRDGKGLLTLRIRCRQTAQGKRSFYPLYNLLSEF
jgi:hypothetical protein